MVGVFVVFFLRKYESHSFSAGNPFLIYYFISAYYYLLYFEAS